MAPKRPSSRPKPGSKSGSKTSKPSSSSSSTPRAKPSGTKSTPRPAGKQVKTRPGIHSAPILGKSNSNSKITKKSPSAPPKRRRTYTDAQLALPALNSIVPFSAAPARKGSGKRRNKVYVDDEEGMRTIMALVNADQEGAIESKLVKVRRLEEIREARRVEGERRGEVREGERRGRLEGVKRGLKVGRGKGKKEAGEGEGAGMGAGLGRKVKGPKKRVSFAGV